jgi:hypothetical protein
MINRKGRDPQCEVHEYLMGDGHCTCEPERRKGIADRRASPAPTGKPEDGLAQWIHKAKDLGFTYIDLKEKGEGEVAGILFAMTEEDGQRFSEAEPAPTGDALREAVEPFRKLLEVFEIRHREKAVYDSHEIVFIAHNDSRADLTLGDLRRLVAALASPGSDGEAGRREP